MAVAPHCLNRDHKDFSNCLSLRQLCRLLETPSKRLSLVMAACGVISAHLQPGIAVAAV